MKVEWCEKKVRNAIHHSTMSIQKDQVATAIGRFDFDKSITRTENGEILLLVGRLVQTKS